METSMSTQDDSDILIGATGLARWYGEHCAVRGLDLELRRGQVLGLLGPNGAGKSTTMSMLAGNLAPTAGSITIGGHDLLDDPRAAKSRLGYLPETPPVYTDLTVDEYLDYVAGLHRIARRARGDACKRAKARCGLTEVGRRLVGNLSKGFQQRVGIAQAIVHDPLVVILDEPTVGLDPIQIREIRDLVRELGREHGVILSTHILPEVLATCTDVKIIHRGDLVFAERITDIDARLREDAVLLRTRNPVDTAALATVAGVTSVDALGDGWRIAHAPYANPADALAALTVERGWGLVELSPLRRTLEQVFVELTTRDIEQAA
jgi:ABC-2 type transport system ATP-binding protein